MTGGGKKALTARQGVEDVRSLFVNEFGWYPREPSDPDYGIDVYVECAADGIPNGRLLGVQVKAGDSFFSEETERGIVFRGEERHLDYWLNHSLPVLLVLYEPGTQTAYWQVISDETIVTTRKGWKVTVPRAQVLSARAADTLADIAQGEPYVLRLGQLESGQTDGAESARHIGVVAQFEGPAPPFAEVLQHLAGRLRPVPRSRQKLVAPFAGLGIERWTDDSGFDLTYHVRHAVLPEPGDRAALEEFVGEVFSQQLDPSKPPWEVWMVEGLHNGGFALVLKTHHALLEGLGGVDLVTTLYDFTPEPLQAAAETGRIPPPAQPSTAAAPASSLRDAAEAAVSLPLRVLRAAVTSLRTSDQVLQAFRLMKWVDTDPAPESPMNVAIGPNRRVSFVDVALSDLTAVKDAFGGTINDVVLTLVAGALRSWMQARGLPMGGLELRAVSLFTHSSGAGGSIEPRINVMLAPLPVSTAEPIECLRCIRDESQRKSQQTPGTDLANLETFVGTTLAQMLRLGSRPRFYNLAVANIPGSALPLYMLGRRMQALHPALFLEGDHALAIGVLSHDGGVYFGLIGDRDVMYDLQVVATGIEDTLKELVAHARHLN